MEAQASFTPFTEQDIGRSIVERFHQVVGAHGDRLAIQSDDTRVTFAELNRIATTLAHRILSHLGPGPEPVALLFDRGADVVAAILAVLKSGKFYVVLDPQNPHERLRHLIADSQSKLIVAPGVHLGLARELLAPGPLLVQLLVEHILVDVALGVEPGTGVAVPPPGPADVPGRVERLDGQALLT